MATAVHCSDCAHAYLTILPESFARAVGRCERCGGPLTILARRDAIAPSGRLDGEVPPTAGGPAVPRARGPVQR